MAAVERPGLAALRAYRQRLLAQGRLVEARAVQRCMRILQEAART